MNNDDGLVEVEKPGVALGQKRGEVVADWLIADHARLFALRRCRLLCWPTTASALISNHHDELV